MYSKDVLTSKSISQLEDIAKEIGAEIKSGFNHEEIIYAILDRQAVVEGNKNPLGTTRKRTRIAKKETDRVYSVNGKEGENFDVKKNKKAVEQPSLFKEKNVEDEAITTSINNKEITTEEQLAKIPKHRGRKTKKELELIEQIEKQEEEKLKEQENQELEPEVKESTTEISLSTTNQKEPITSEENFVPEAAFSTNNLSSNSKELNQEDTLIQQLKEKINSHNETQEIPQEDFSEGLWEGDPGDGTDFITVLDIPIEDQGAMPTFDIFDNPTTPLATSSISPTTNFIEEPQQSYDFSDIITSSGVLEIMPDGYGFLRSSDYNYLSSPDDIYVATSFIKRYGLKTGDVVYCHVRPPHDGEKYFPLTSIDKINGRNPSEVRDRISFEHLTPLFPDEKFNLCNDRSTTNLSTRIVDLFSPIGKGQRALIVAQPKTGKTILMKDIAG